ncbi:MAG: ANTAR domain-containing protein [Gammaproteobacteria bacterium]|nr:ANTAR domain-containing protein [Gammaproteobacteria bacterium]
MKSSGKSQQPIRVLLVDNRFERRLSLEQSLSEVGCEVVGNVSNLDDLLENVRVANPDVVIMDIESPCRDTLDSLRSVQSSAPRPIVMFSQDDNGEMISRAIRAGVSAYVVDDISQKRVRPIVDAAIERFLQFRDLTRELENTRVQLTERKQIDKAKGILMKQRGMSEEEAYKAMRDLAMGSNKRIADVAVSIITAASLLIQS